MSHGFHPAPGIDGLHPQGGETILADRPQRFAGIAFSLSLRQQRVADVSFVRIFRTDAEPNIAQRLAEFIAQYKHPGIGTATDEDAAQRPIA